MKRLMLLSVPLSVLLAGCALHSGSDSTPKPVITDTEIAAAKVVLAFVCPAAQDPAALLRKCLPSIKDGNAFKRCLLDECDWGTPVPPAPPATNTSAPLPTATSAPAATSTTAPPASSPTTAAAKPPVGDFWRGIKQASLGTPRVRRDGKVCYLVDTTMWFVPTTTIKGGAHSCDRDHFGTPDNPGMGPTCSWRPWDDPRGPWFKVVSVSAGGGVEVPDLGFGGEVCAIPGTVAKIDTCPRPDSRSCVDGSIFPGPDERLPAEVVEARCSVAGYIPLRWKGTGCYSEHEGTMPELRF